jgi:hypothetical protein
LTPGDSFNRTKCDDQVGNLILSDLSSLNKNRDWEYSDDLQGGYQLDDDERNENTP